MGSMAFQSSLTKDYEYHLDTNSSNIISTIADYFSMEIINLPPLERIVDSEMQEGG